MLRMRTIYLPLIERFMIAWFARAQPDHLNRNRTEGVDSGRRPLRFKLCQLGQLWQLGQCGNLGMMKPAMRNVDTWPLVQRLIRQNNVMRKGSIQLDERLTKQL